MAPEAQHPHVETTGDPAGILTPVLMADACTTAAVLAQGGRLWMFADRLVYVDLPFASKRGFRTVLASRNHPAFYSANKRQARDGDNYRVGHAYHFTPDEWARYLAGQGAARIHDIPWESIQRSRLKVHWSGETRLRLELRNGSTLVIKWRTGCGADARLSEILPFQNG